jgi:O-antigen/teichoic acid export membrane protein
MSFFQNNDTGRATRLLLMATARGELSPVAKRIFPPTASISRPTALGRADLTLANVAAIAPTDYSSACGFARRGRTTSDNDAGFVLQCRFNIFDHVHRMSGRERMLRKTLKNFASQLLSLLISIGDRFLLTAVLLRMWPTDLFADWTTLLAWSGLLGLADLGFGIFVGNRLQKALGTGDNHGFQRQVGTAAFIYALLGLLMVVTAALLAVLESASPFVAVSSLSTSEASLILFSLGAMQAVTTTKSAFTQIYRAYGEYSRGIVIESVSSLCIVVASLAAALGGAGPRVMALTYIAAQLVFAWGILLTDLRRRYPTLRLWPLPPSVSELREAGLAMRWYALTYAAPTMWLQAPVLVLSALGLGGPVVVTFVLHRTLVNFGRNIVAMLSTAGGVELAPHVHSGNTVLIERGMTYLGRSVAAIGGVMAAGLMTFGASIVQLWTGKSDLFDMSTLFWLVIPAIVVAPAIPLVYLAHLADIPKQQAIGQVTQTLVAIAVAVPLAGSFGAAGVAFAMAIGEIVSIGLVLPILLTRRLGITYWRHAIRCVPIALAALVWSGAVGRVVLLAIGMQDWVRLIVSLGIWAAVALLPIASLLMPASQHKRLRDAVRAFCVKRTKEA